MEEFRLNRSYRVVSINSGGSVGRELDPAHARKRHTRPRTTAALVESPPMLTLSLKQSRPTHTNVSARIDVLRRIEAG